MTVDATACLVCCEDCEHCTLFPHPSDANLDEWGCAQGVFARRRLLRNDGHLHHSFTRPHECEHYWPRPSPGRTRDTERGD